MYIYPPHSKINTIKDIELLFPGLTQTTKNWFKTIKLSDGKKANPLLYEESHHDQKKAIEIIDLNHNHWK